MKTTIKMLSSVVLVSALLSGQAMAAGYLKIDDIKGESQNTQTANPDGTSIENGTKGHDHSGMATGKRQHKPISSSTGSTDDNSEDKSEQKPQGEK